MIVLEQLPHRPSDWDEVISTFSTKTLFHESSWLDHVQSVHPEGRIVYYAIRDGDAQIGFYCALRITRLMIPIHGSPLGGTGTNFMGPLVNDGVDQRALINAITKLFGPRHFLHLELSNQWLDRSVMADAGFEIQDSVTHLCSVAPDTDAAFASLTTEARNRIRKAERNQLTVERVNDPDIVPQFFAQFEEVYGKQGMVTPYGIERPRSLFAHLAPAGRLLALRVRHADEVVATGLFPHDERAIYFWGAASWLQHQKLCPNEALHWGVFQFAVERGIPVYNMCGGRNQFKSKFGGEDVPYITYYKSAIPLLKTARRLYRDRHFRRLKTRSKPT